MKCAPGKTARSAKVVNCKCVRFGDPKMPIRKHIPAAKQSFCARHRCRRALADRAFRGCGAHVGGGVLVYELGTLGLEHRGVRTLRLRQQQLHRIPDEPKVLVEQLLGRRAVALPLNGVEVSDPLLDGVDDLVVDQPGVAERGERLQRRAVWRCVEW